MAKSSDGDLWKTYSSKTVEMLLKETVEEYQPTGSDDCMSSPEKSSTNVKNNQKQNKQDATSTSTQPLPTKYHIAMTSKLQEFINDVKLTRKCALEDGCEGSMEERTRRMFEHGGIVSRDSRSKQ
ncbi:hypothetical protein AC249_AIPGENE22769 [Exaiptasia diaphana]|nr:hypothetical protein AC249_AIPGENE22769 [Exaiptasia diaphana]